MRVYCRTPLRQGWVPEPRSVDTVPEVAKAILNLLATGPLTGLAAESLPIFAHNAGVESWSYIAGLRCGVREGALAAGIRSQSGERPLSDLKRYPFPCLGMLHDAVY